MCVSICVFFLCLYMLRFQKRKRFFLESDADPDKKISNIYLKYSNNKNINLGRM